MPQLDPTWFISQFFWLCISFGVLYFVVSKFLAPRIAKIKTLRQEKIDGYINKAQSFNKEAEKSLKEYEKAIGAAKEDAFNAISKQKKELAKLIENKNQEVAKKIADDVLQTEKLVNKAKADALVKVDEIAKTLSKEIIKKLDV